MNLSKEQKQEIVLTCGSSMINLNKAEIVLNELGIIYTEEDLYEVLCLIALESEAMKDMKNNKSHLARRSLSEIIAAVISQKFDIINLPIEQRVKVKRYIKENTENI